MRLNNHPSQRTHVESPEHRLFKDISYAVQKICTKAGQNLLKAKTESDITAVRNEAKDSIKKMISFWRRSSSPEAVSKVLKNLSLSEYDV
jgi:hypothetical protein